MIPILDYPAWKRRCTAPLDGEVEDSVRGIIDQVNRDGDKALRALTERFDGVLLDEIRVPEAALAAAHEQAPPEWRSLIETAADNIRRFHVHQCQESWYIDDGDGVRLGQRIVPLERAGLYVPGGTAAYPSSVLMNAIPAQVAGVSEIHLVSPPTESGRPHDGIMAAAHALGLTHVYAIGGAQAVAALTYGTETVPRVDKIVGPGSTYVAAAKRQVYGLVDIDSLAGPSEVVILADHTANPVWVAYDLLAQAEHDVQARAILVTPDANIAHAVQRHVQRLVPTNPRRDILEEALRDHGACIVANDLDEAVSVVNELAPEHLELLVEDPWAMLERVKHAGAIFLGPWSPEPVGDYFAGPNHVLPTGGTARYASALGVDDFIRKQSVIAYTRARLEKTAGAIAAFARSETLEAHARAVEVRVNKGMA